MISGIFTGILLVLFIVMVFWAYSDKRKDDFEYLSHLPLDNSQTKSKEINNKNIEKEGSDE